MLGNVFVFLLIVGIAMTILGVEGHAAREYPAGVRVLWEADRLEIREGEWTWSFATLFRVAAGLFFGGLLAVILVAAASTSWGLLVFASPAFALLVYFLIATLGVRHVRVDAGRREITVRRGLVCPFITRRLALADFTLVRIDERRGTLSGPAYAVRLEGARKPLEISSAARFAHETRALARQLGCVAGLPVL